jgi:hypothetical protein
MKKKKWQKKLQVKIEKIKASENKKYFKNEHIKNIHKKWWWKKPKTFRDINELNSKKSIYILFATSKKINEW